MEAKGENFFVEVSNDVLREFLKIGADTQCGAA